MCNENCRPLTITAETICPRGDRGMVVLGRLVEILSKGGMTYVSHQDQIF